MDKWTKILNSARLEHYKRYHHVALIGNNFINCAQCHKHAVIHDNMLTIIINKKVEQIKPEMF